MKELIKNTREKLKDGISVSITSEMFSTILKSQNEKIEAEGIHNVEVQFVENYIKVTGSAKKLLLNIPFKMELIPSGSENRIVKFAIGSMTPLNQDWIKKKIFNKPPFVSYENELLQLNLNGFEIVRKVPIGKIRDFQIEDNKMKVKIGL